MAKLQLLEGGDSPPDLLGGGPGAFSCAATLKRTCGRCGGSFVGVTGDPLCLTCKPRMLEWMLEAVRALKTT
jgi:hypothetical protein